MNEDIKAMTVNVSIKDTWHFQKILEIISKAITDERIAKAVRQEYFDELNASFDVNAN